MEQYEKESMTKLLKYAKNSIPYYAKLLKNADVESCVESIYSSLPYQTKAMMRDSVEYQNETINKSNTDLIVKITGGTTGEPWHITKTFNESTSYFNMLWKSRLQFGIKPGDHFYQFGGYGEIDGVFTTKQVIEEKAFTELSMFHLNDQILDSYIDILELGKGNWFFANPSALYILALRMKDRHIKGIGKIKYVELTGERVYSYQEEVIKEVFDCPVSIMYGSREITTISHRCRYGTYHILPNLYIETVDENDKIIDKDKNELGEVVVTSFIDKYMPFIKYKTGDYAILKRKNDCECGRKGLIFEELIGRTPAYVDIDGNKVHLEITYYLMDKFNRIYGPRIKHFQVIFRKPNIFHFIFVVDSQDIEECVFNFYDKELSEAVNGVKVEAEFVDVIKRTKRKLNPFVIEE
jgi:phenylacetate-CoA ligase